MGLWEEYLRSRSWSSRFPAPCSPSSLNPKLQSSIRHAQMAGWVALLTFLSCRIVFIAVWTSSAESIRSKAPFIIFWTTMIVWIPVFFFAMIKKYVSCVCYLEPAFLELFDSTTCNKSVTKMSAVYIFWAHARARQNDGIHFAIQKQALLEPGALPWRLISCVVASWTWWKSSISIFSQYITNWMWTKGFQAYA